MIHLILVSVFPLLLLTAAAHDVTTFRIPNLVNILILLSFFPMAWLISMDFTTMGWHMAAAATMFVVTFLMFCVGWIGGGDAKMASAIALWMGFPHLLTFVVFTAVAGGALALLFLAWNVVVSQQVFAHTRITLGKVKLDRLPYGTAIAVGGLFTYQATEWVNYFS